VEERVESNVATNCGSFCTCKGLANNKCLFGPDATGMYYTDSAAASELVDSCKEGFGCICDTHGDIVAQMEAENKTFDEIAIEWTENAVDITNPNGASTPETTMILDAKTGETSDSMPTARPIEGKVEIVKPIVINDELTCPDGFDLSSSTSECIPYKVQQDSGMPLWAFVLLLTLVLLVFAIILFIAWYQKRKRLIDDKEKRMEAERLEWERKQKE